MALWFLRGLRRGVVTTRYPDAPADAWAQNLSTPPVFTADALTVAIADELAAVCPSGALRRDGAVLRYDVGACTACGRCLRVTAGVLRPSGEFELATRRREHLVKHIRLRGGSDDDN
ncbi:MAG: hypothetical protein ACRDRL_08185 [Sciscionella sp.]